MIDISQVKRGTKVKMHEAWCPVSLTGEYRKSEILLINSSGLVVFQNDLQKERGGHSEIPVSDFLLLASPVEGEE